MNLLACERTPEGWQGLTDDGEILNVQASNGSIPFEETSQGSIEIYRRHFDQALLLLQANQTGPALDEINTALQVAPTHRARFNRAMILLAHGQWREGLQEFHSCESSSEVFMRPLYREALEMGLTPWQGESIAGKRLLLIHDHGFGDSLMMLRYVPRLRAMGAEVVLLMPPELQSLAWQLAPVTSELVMADYFCSILMLLHFLKQDPENIPTAPYLRVDPDLALKWRLRVGAGRNTGLAWSVGRLHDGDFPRSIPLQLLTEACSWAGNLISVQQQGAAEAKALGVAHYKFSDFADCAALMSVLDEIVTVDTAAVHLAGATGHRNITLLLSHWASWRWHSPLYQNVRVCRQQSPGDWQSALVQRQV